MYTLLYYIGRIYRGEEKGGLLRKGGKGMFRGGKGMFRGRKSRKELGFGGEIRRGLNGNQTRAERELNEN